MALIDGEFVYIEKDNYINLLRFEEVTEECSAFQSQVEVWVEEQKTILSTKEPCTEPGRQCRNPYKCCLKERTKKDVNRQRRLTESLKIKIFWVRSSILCVIATKRKTSTIITINKRDLAS